MLVGLDGSVTTIAICNAVVGCRGEKHMTRTGTFCVSALLAFLVFVLPSAIVAVGASREQLRPVIEWVQAEGGPNRINGQIAKALGIRTLNEGGVPTTLSITHKAFRLQNSVVYSFALAVVDGRRKVILEHYTSTEYRGWRLGEDGVVSKTVSVENDSSEIRQHEGLTFEKEFNLVLDYFISKASEAKSK